MKAMTYSEYGGPEVISIEELEDPVPGDDEVLIRVRACSVNDWDWSLLRGDFANRCINGLGRPKKVQTVGSDIAGEIEAVGSGVTRLQLGDRVYGDLSGHRFGGFAEYVCARERDVALMPDGMTFVHAAAIPQAGVLASQALLDHGEVKSGQRVLINGAGGGVGSLGIQILKSIGDIETTGVDSGIKLPLMRDLGFDHVVDYTREDFTAGDAQYDLIVDARTARPPWRHLSALKPEGRYVTVGGHLGRLAQFGLCAPVINLFSRKKLKMVMLKANKDLPLFNRLFAEGKLQPVIDGPYRLQDLRAVFERYAQGRQLGKMVVEMRAASEPICPGTKSGTA